MAAKKTNRIKFKIEMLFDNWINFLVIIAFLMPFSAASHTNSNSFLHTELKEEAYGITVTVLDGDTDEPLAYATVFIDQKFNGLTDDNGRIEVTDVAHRDIVNFSYVGYNSVKVPVHQLRKSGGLVKLYTNNVIEGIVVVSRTESAEEELPFQIDRIDQKKIQSRNSQSTADVLGEHGDVYIQKSQGGGGSPIVRGFEANKVLLVLDGVRLNNAIYRNGHLQNAITVDASMLEAVEVIYGPGSLMYGSEALGGVIHFRSRDPKVLFDTSKDKILKTNVFTRFSSANIEKTIHADLEYGVRRWASLTSLTYAKYGDMKSGSKRPDAYPDFGKRRFYVDRNEVDMVLESADPNIQQGTGFGQIDFMQKIRYQPSDHLYFIANFQYSSSSNVPRYDNLSDTLDTADRLKYSEWYYGPQKRLMASLKMKSLKNRVFYDKAILIAAYQKIEEDRLNRKFRKVHRTFNLEDVHVYSFTGDFEKHLDERSKHTFSYGFDGNYNQVYSESGEINVETGELREGVFTRYPSDMSSMLTYAGYANYRWKGLDSMLVFNAGVRYSQIDLFARYKESDLEMISWPEAYVNEGVTANNSDLTWGAGLTLNTRNKWQVHLLSSKAFRSPNIDDFAKLRVKGSQAVLPNTELKPETAFSSEVTLGKTFGNDRTSFKLSGTVFYTKIDDVIIRTAGFTPDGEDRIYIPTEERFFDVQQNFNANSGTIRGFSGNALLKMGPKWELQSSISLVKGRVQYLDEELGIDTLVPMGHIPPTYGQTGLLFKTGKFRLETVLKYNAKKKLEEYAVSKISLDGDQLVLDREGTSDNIEYAIAYKDHTTGNVVYEGLYGWATINFYTSYQINEKFSVDVALENLTDRHYRHFSSGISAPGRNFILTLRGKF